MDEKIIGMRREDDIRDAVDKHFARVKNLVKQTPPLMVGFKLMIFWTRNKGSEFISLDTPEFVLQEFLKGGPLNAKMEQYGKKALVGSKPKGVPANAHPMAVIVSTEAILPSAIMPNDEHTCRVRGMPVLVIAGRTENGKRHAILTPLATDGDNENRRDIEPLFEVTKGVFKKLPPPPKLVQTLDEMKANMDDIIAPFFEGYRNGGTPTENFLGIT